MSGPSTAPAPDSAAHTLRRPRPHPGRVGRPLDPLVTERVIGAVQMLLATRGALLSADAIAVQAGVGKATIYRRWTTVVDLIAEAVLTVDPLPPDSVPSGSTRSQLTSLLRRLSDPLTETELTVAAALAQAGWQPRLHEAVERVLLAPLRERVRTACAGTEGAPEHAVATVVAVVEGLWVRRLLLAPPPLEDAEITRVVDDAVQALGPPPALAR